MKYVLTGSAGQITRPLAQRLLRKGHEVTVIGRTAENLQSLVDAGARAAIGSVEDPSFLQKTFRQADAVYTMVPPQHNPRLPLKEHIASVGKIYADSIRGSGVGYVVNLSSLGAHRSGGCGPVSGLHQVEQLLNGLSDVHIRHLRPSYFFSNLFSQIPLIRNMNFMGANFGEPGFRMVWSATEDIAETAFEELQSLDFIGHSHLNLASDERAMTDVAQALGRAIGKPQLQWLVFTDEQAKTGLMQAGLSEDVAKNYVEIGQAFRAGILLEDYWKHRPPVPGKTKLEDFATVFAEEYKKF